MEAKKVKGTKSPGRGYLYVNLADEIMQYIRKENIRPGERIPSERNLAEYFSTSRASVREAVRILENNNILDIQIGNGMFVKAGASPEIYQIEVWKIDYLEILDVRAILELHIIEELCRYIPSESLCLSEEALRQLEDGYRRGFFDQSADLIFHKRLRAASSNQTLIQLLEGLVAKLDSYARQLDEATSFKYWYGTVPYHRRMLDGIKEHDVEKARRAFNRIYELDKKALSGDL